MEGETDSKWPAQSTKALTVHRLDEREGKKKKNSGCSSKKKGGMTAVFNNQLSLLPSFSSNTKASFLQD